MPPQIMQPVPMPRPVTLPDILQTGLGLGTQIQQFRALPEVIRQQQARQAAQTALIQAQTGAIPSEEALRRAQAGYYGAETGMEPLRIQIEKARLDAALRKPQERLSPFGQAMTDYHQAISVNDPDAESYKNYALSLVKTKATQEQLPPDEKALLQATGKQYAEMEKGAVTGAQSAQQGIENVDNFVKNYNEAWTKGPYIGPLASIFTPSLQRANMAHTNLVRALLSATKGLVRLTNFELRFTQGSALRINQMPSTIHEQAPIIKALFERQKEYPKFLTVLRTNGVTDPATARSLWDEYINTYPVLRPATAADPQGFHPENVIKWKEFATKDSIAKIKRGESIIPRGITPAAGIPSPIPGIATPTVGQLYSTRLGRNVTIDEINEAARNKNITPAEVRRRLGMM